jgi:hypothetical protein
MTSRKRSASERHQREVGPGGDARAAGIGRHAEAGAQLVERGRDQRHDLLGAALLRDAHGDRGRADRVGGDRAGELADLADDDVRPPHTTRGEHAGVRGARVDPREDVADDARGLRLVGVAHGGEDRVALASGRVVEGPQRQARRPDHRRRLAWSRDDDVGARAAQDAGEGDERAEVSRTGLGGHEDAHSRPDAPSGIDFP